MIKLRQNILCRRYTPMLKMTNLVYYLHQFEFDQYYKSYMQKLQVLEFQGLAPSVFCGMYFADAGSKVTIIARNQPPAFGMPIHQNIMNRNKKCVTLSFKDKTQLNIVKKMMLKADIVIDPFRPGVLEKMKLGPLDIWEQNPRLIYIRISGYGQQGPLHKKPGHDLNYLAVAGILPHINLKEPLQFPANYYADFVSCSLSITGALLALIDRQKTGKGQVVDVSLMSGCKYLANFLSGEPKQAQDYRYSQKDDTILCHTAQKTSELQRIPPFQNPNIEYPFKKHNNLSNKIPQRGQNTQQQLLRYGISLQQTKSLLPKAKL